MTYRGCIKLDRQRRNAIATIAITIALLALLVGLAPSGQSTPTSGAKAFTWLRSQQPPVRSKAVGIRQVAQGRTLEVQVVTLPARLSSRAHP